MTDTQKLDALDKLIKAVESGRQIIFSAKDVCSCVGWEFPNNKVKWFIQAERGSLDAALAMHNALLPGFQWRLVENRSWVWRTPSDLHGGDEVEDDAGKGLPARAWLLAILKAYRAQVAQ